jgi:hypothetical protein
MRHRRLTGLNNIDRRTKEWTRLTDIFAALATEVSDTGELSDVMAQRIQEAAELTLLCEKAREQAMQGNGDLAVAARLHNIKERTLKSLGVSPSRPADKRPSLEKYLSERGNAA